MFFSAAQLAGGIAVLQGFHDQRIKPVAVRMDNSLIVSYTLTQLLPSLPALAPAPLIFSFKLWPAGAYFASKTEVS